MSLLAVMTIITLPIEDIWTKFHQIYPGKEHDWLFASYQLGFRTVLVKRNNKVVVPMCDPETVTAFNCGCLEGWQVIQDREEVQKMSHYTTSTPERKSNRSKSTAKIEEYEPGF